jgi:Recombination endonuclease VII
MKVSKSLSHSKVSHQLLNIALPTQVKCNSCKVVKDINEFHKDRSSKSGVTRSCKSCNMKRASKHRERNPDYDLMRRYGISRDQAVEFWDSQGRCCKSCKTPTPQPPHRNSVIDHRHSDGKVRGILCHGCNTALGLLREDPKAIEGLLTYLVQSRG